MNEQDKADIERAATMVKDGKSLRQRVLSRIRQRNWRKRQKDKTDG